MCTQNIEQYVKLTFMSTLSDELHGSWDMVEEEECVAGVTASLHIWAKGRQVAHCQRELFFFACNGVSKSTHSGSDTELKGTVWSFVWNVVTSIVLGKLYHLNVCHKCSNLGTDTASDSLSAYWVGCLDSYYLNVNGLM